MDLLCWAYYGVAGWFLSGAFTFIHAIKELMEILSFAIIKMLLPGLSILTPQHDELALIPPHGSEMRDLNNHRAVRHTTGL